MQTATSDTESKSLHLSIYVHHYTLRAPCPKGQGNRPFSSVGTLGSTISVETQMSQKDGSIESHSW